MIIISSSSTDKVFSRVFAILNFGFYFLGLFFEAFDAGFKRAACRGKVDLRVRFGTELHASVHRQKVLYEDGINGILGEWYEIEVRDESYSDRIRMFR